MDLPTVKEAIRVAVRDSCAVAGVWSVPDTDVYWNGQAKAASWHGLGASGSNPEVILRILALASSGIDEVRYKYVATPEPHREKRLVGNRRLVLQVKVRSCVQTDGSDALMVSEAFRTNLRRKETLAGLYAAGVSLATIHAGVNLDEAVQGRLDSVWVTDVILLVAEVTLDPNETGGWIDSVSGTLTTKLPDGSSGFNAP